MPTKYEEVYTESDKEAGIVIEVTRRDPDETVKRPRYSIALSGFFKPESGPERRTKHMKVWTRFDQSGQLTRVTSIAHRVAKMLERAEAYVEADATKFDQDTWNARVEKEEAHAKPKVQAKPGLKALAKQDAAKRLSAESAGEAKEASALADALLDSNPELSS